MSDDKAIGRPRINDPSRSSPASTLTPPDGQVRGGVRVHALESSPVLGGLDTPPKDTFDPGTGLPRPGGADATGLQSRLPPAGLGLGASEAQGTLGQALRDVRAKAEDPELGARLDAALRAHEIATRGIEVEELRLTVKKSASRPKQISGYLERTVKSPSQNARPHLRFKPAEKDLQPISLLPNDLEGIRNGARIRLELQEASDDGQATYRVKADESAYASAFLGQVELEDGKAFARGLEAYSVYRRVPLAGTVAPELLGKEVLVDVARPMSKTRVGQIREVIGDPSSLPSKLLKIAVSEGASSSFSVAAVAQTEAIQKMSIEGKSFRHLPFVTIDNDDSMDLDQAVCIQKRPDGGYDIHYAIADVPYFIPENSPLDREAKSRANTYYLPGGRNIPMLPRELSEGIISLLPNVPRRAFVVSTSIDAQGEVIESRFERGVIESRAKLAYNGVQKFHDLQGEARAAHPVAGKDFTETLELLEAVGKLRLAKAEQRGAQPSPEEAPGVALGHDGKLQVRGRERNDVERWNEQVSLLANEAVGRALRESGSLVLHRLQPPPSPDRLEAFRIFADAIGRPWPESQSISAYLRGLDPKDPLTEIIQERSRGCHAPAEYSPHTHGHNALALEDYAHFTAPMRRYVDVVNARLLASLVEPKDPSRKEPSKLSEHFLESVARQALEAKRRTRNIETRVERVLNAAYFAGRLGETVAGQIIGVRPSGVRVKLDEGLHVDVPANALRTPNDEPPALVDSGTALESSRGRFAIGDALSLKIVAADPALEVCRLEPISAA